MTNIALKNSVVFQAAEDLDMTCAAMLTGPDGKFTNFSIDRDLAWLMVTELVYHLRRQEERIANAPIQVSSIQAER